MADAFVQGESAVNFGATTVAGAMAGNTTTGNVLAVMVWWKNITDTVVSVTDGTNTLIDSGLGVQVLNGMHSAQLFYKENITGLTTPTITVTMSGSPSRLSFAVVELSGRLTSGALDKKQWNTQNFTGTGTDFITSGSVTTLGNDEAIVGFTSAEFSAAQVEGTNFTLRNPTSNNDRIYAETLTAGNQVAAGAIAATFTPGGNDGWITGVMTFKSASGGGPSLLYLDEGSTSFQIVQAP